MLEIVKQLKKTVVFLGYIVEKEGKQVNQFVGTGFLIQVNGRFCLVTAKHVIVDNISSQRLDQNMVVFFNLKGGGITYRPISLIKQLGGVDWVFHSNQLVDIAVIPFALDEGKDDVKVMPDELFQQMGQVHEIDQVFFISYQPGIESTAEIRPIFRFGDISTINNDKTCYIDATCFPGNSGSPVFYKPSPIWFKENQINFGQDPSSGKFIGILGEYLTYKEVAISEQTRRPRIVFEENTGLSKVWSAEWVEEIVKSEQFKKQLELFEQNINKQNQAQK